MKKLLFIAAVVVLPFLSQPPKQGAKIVIDKRVICDYGDAGISVVGQKEKRSIPASLGVEWGKVTRVVTFDVTAGDGTRTVIDIDSYKQAAIGQTFESESWEYDPY